MTEVLTPPGKAQITRCGSCDATGRTGSRECPDCEGTGWFLYRACPRCGDIGWDYVGPDRRRMACRISCGATWDADYPGWVIQRLPDGWAAEHPPPGPVPRRGRPSLEDLKAIVDRDGRFSRPTH